MKTRVFLARSAAALAALVFVSLLIVFGSDGEVERKARLRMVAEQIETRGIKDPTVLSALRAVPRQDFVPVVLRLQAYEDTALPIGEGQTISQPYIVALMTSLIQPKREMRVLEIGTGSGYQAAVLSQCVQEVDT